VALAADPRQSLAMECPTHELVMHLFEALTDEDLHCFRLACRGVRGAVDRARSPKDARASAERACTSIARPECPCMGAGARS